ncbi:MAG: peptidase [Verrucomicrobia bacterium]|nr:peptidase [Verrucomicrobiota bacterium]
MLSWSINLFRIRGIQLAVHGSFFLLLAYAAFEGWQEAGGIGLLWSVGVLVAFFACVVLHELGHSFTAMGYGVRVRRILLMPIGGMAEMDSIPRQPSQELLVTLAGPAVNFAIAALLAATVGVPAGWHLFGFTDFPDTLRGFLQLLLHWNLLMGCFNLLPVFPMDGGRIFRALLATRLPYLRATRVAANVGKVLAIAGALLAILVYQHFLTAFLFVFIILAGEAEYRAVQRRDFDETRWRRMSAELHGRPSLVEEPPVLGP